MSARGRGHKGLKCYFDSRYKTRGLPATDERSARASCSGASFPGGLPAGATEERPCISRFNGDTEMRLKAQIDGFPNSVRPWTRPLNPPLKPLPDGAPAGGGLYNRNSGTGEGRFLRHPTRAIATAGPESRFAHLGLDPPFSPSRAEASRTIPPTFPLSAPLQASGSNRRARPSAHKLS